MRARLRALAALILLLSALRFPAARAEDEAPIFNTDPPAWQLVAEGVAMSIPEYFRGVAQHEGSHALMVVMFGGKVTGFDIFPKEFNGHIRFGETDWEGTFTRNQKVLIDMAPKITDLGIMAAYTAAFESGVYPENKHVQLVLLVVATSVWIDFSKDIFSTRDDNDTVDAFNQMGLTTESQRLPYRIAWGVLSAGAAVEIGRGFYKLFKHGDPQKPRDPTKPSISLELSPSFVGVGGTY